MKAISLTALAITAYLILVHLITPNNANTRKPYSLSSREAAANYAITHPAAFRVEPASAPGTGLETKSESAGIIDTSAAKIAEGGTSVEPAVVDVGDGGGSANDPVQAAEAAPVVTENVPAATGQLAEPFTIAVAPQQVELAPLESPQLEAFIDKVVNGQAGQVVGVFVQDTLALPVVQQPQGQSNYVSVQDNLLTQFASPMAYGTIGLLAHNYLSGKLFSWLSENQEVIVVYGDGQQQAYRIDHIQRFQALDPNSAYSNFIDVADPARAVISAGELFARIYTQPDQLVFQTCIEANGDTSWGRLFVTAEKVAD